jgi:hypothetical protein
MNRREHAAQIAAEERATLTGTETPEAILTRLRGRQVSAIEALYVLEELLGITHSAAKDALATHPAWRDIVNPSGPIQDAAESAAQLIENPRNE